MEIITYRPLVWLFAIVALAVAARYSLVDRPLLLHWLSHAFRAAAVALLVLALCRPYIGRESRDVHTIFLVDVSQSVALDQIPQAVDQIDAWIRALGPRDAWSLFALGKGTRAFETVDELREMLKKWQAGLTDDAFRSASQLGDALLATQATFLAGKSRRFVLLTDGQETEASLADALRKLKEDGVDVQWHAMGRIQDAEAAVIALEPSSRDVFFGEMTRMRVELAANQPLAGKLRLVHKGVAVQSRDVQLQPGKTLRMDLDVAMNTPGSSVWTAELITDRDHFAVNNRLSTTVNVRGRPRVLALHRDPRELRPLTRALAEQELEIEVRGEHGLPATMQELSSFDAVVLADIPATNLTPRQMQMLKQYVVDLGGGLAMFGSENSFGLGGYYKTPVEDALPLISRYEKEKDKPSLAMVLVIDKSGSMQGVPIELARQAAKAAVELLSPRDSIGVIGFDGEAQVVCEMTSAGDVDAVQAAIDSLMAGGGTYMYPAMVVGKEMLESTPAKIRHMICLSDGMTQPANHETLAEEMAEAGMTVSTVVLGAGDKQLMSAIAEIGRGRYYETDDPANVPQIFTKETMQATKSAIKEDLYGSVQTGDHAAMAGYEQVELPFTLGYVMTEAKPTAQLLLAAETGDPLLAVGRYGLGTGLAYTSDLTEKWGGEWLAWDGCGKFWAQMLRGIVRRNDASGLEVGSHYAADRWLLDLRRTDEVGNPVSGINWDATTIDSNGTTTSVPVSEIGLGRYSASVPLAGRDSVTLRLGDTVGDKVKILHWNRPYAREYRLAQETPAEITALARANPHSVSKDVHPIRTRSSIVHYAYFGAIACTLLSVLLRRI